LIFAMLAQVFGPPVWAEEPGYDTALSDLLGDVEISCASLVIAEYKSAEFLTTGPPVRVPFDRELCAAELTESDSARLLQPILRSLAASSGSTVDWEKESVAEREKRIAQDEKEQQLIWSELQENFRPLFATCTSLGQKPNPSAVRLCYFGGPTEGSGGPFRAAFHAMVNNSLPPDESLCALESKPDWNRVEPEFMPIREHFGSGTSWQKIRLSLEQDGFRCSGGTEDYCTKMVLGVSSNNLSDTFLADEWPGSHLKNVGLIIPRILEVYKGPWRQLGPSSHRCRLSAAKCPEHRPARGAQAGICLVGEDWHIWGPPCPKSTGSGRLSHGI
jgi:hypothetical protein